MQISKTSSFKRAAMVGLGVIALLTVATGCSSNDDTAATTTVAESSSPSGTAVAALLKKSTEVVLVDQSITLDGELACTGDISATQGTVTGSCAGTDTDGNAIASTLDGTAKLTGVNSCKGTFIVTSAAEVINEDKNFNCRI